MGGGESRGSGGLGGWWGSRAWVDLVGGGLGR